MVRSQSLSLSHSVYEFLIASFLVTQISIPVAIGSKLFIYDNV